MATIEELNDENANFKTQNKELENDVKQLEDDIKQLENDVKQLEANNRKHYTNLNTSNEEILNSELLSLIDSNHLEIKKKETKIKMIEERIKMIEEIIKEKRKINSISITLNGVLHSFQVTHNRINLESIQKLHEKSIYCLKRYFPDNTLEL